MASQPFGPRVWPGPRPQACPTSAWFAPLAPAALPACPSHACTPLYYTPVQLDCIACLCCLPAPLSAPCLLRTHSHHVPCIALECAAVFQLPAAPFHSFHSSPASSICLLPRPPNGHRPPVNTAHAHSTPRVLQQGGYRGAGAAGMKGYRCTRGGGTLEQAAAPHFHSFLMDMFCGGWWEGGKRAEEVVGGCWLLSWVR